MNEYNDLELLAHVSKALMLVAQSNTPQTFMSLFMGGVVANVIGSLPDEYWQRCMKAEPCGKPMCDCHLLAARVMPVLDMVRRDYKEHAPKAGFSG